MTGSARWLDILLRARQADEDIAARKLATAQRAVVEAVEQARVESARAAALMQASTPVTVSAFLAGAAVAQATAASASAALQRVAICEQDVLRERSSVITASRSRRITENLIERRRIAAETERRRLEQAEQDDLASTRGAHGARAEAQGRVAS